MSTLADVLYPTPPVRRTPLSLLSWWESRRLTYNRAVGTAGLVSLAVMQSGRALTGLPLGSLRDMAMAALVYALAANVCYTFGWGIEMVARWAWGERAPRMGPLLFREGLIFSVGLTLLPILLTVVMVVARTVSAIFG